MAKYTVAVAFQDIDGITKQPGWQVELSLDRAIRLHRWGFIVGPISRPVPPSAWQTIAGTARRATSREENVAGLASACALANDLWTQLNAHYADVADHTTAPDTDHVIVGPGAISLAALLTLTAEMLTRMEIAQAGRLRSMGLVGSAGPELAVKPPAEKAIETRPERAVKEPQERRARWKKAPQEHRTRREKVKDEVDADNAAGY